MTEVEGADHEFGIIENIHPKKDIQSSRLLFHHSSLVRAGSLDVATLLALIADALSRRLLAVTAQVANLAAVIALLSLSAVTRHVAVAAARVAGLRTATTTVAAAAATVATLVSAIAGWTTFRAVAGNVANLATLVALLATWTAKASAAASAKVGWSTLRAVARNVSILSAAVARLFLLRFRAFSADVTFSAAVVAGWRAAFWTVTGLVGMVSAVEASSTAWSWLVVHGERRVGWSVWYSQTLLGDQRQGWRTR